MHSICTAFSDRNAPSQKPRKGSGVDKMTATPAKWTMTEIDRLCATCAEQGVEPILAELRDPAVMCEVARACAAAAEGVDAANDPARVERLRDAAERLRSEAHYLIYLQFPYD